MKRIAISVSGQRLHVFEGADCLVSFRISTAAKGMGCKEGSLRTPTGRFTISEKIGDDAPLGTIFKARVASGLWMQGEDSSDDLILTRIIRLRGMDPWNANTMDRYIYIHGTNHESLIGSPASHGCIRMGNEDMVRLYGMVNPGDLVEIHPDNPEGWPSFMWDVC